MVQGDMRSFMLNKKFDLIFIGFNSFLHLLTDVDVNNFFTCVKAHMHQTSRFLIDVFIPSPLFLYRPEGVRYPVLEYTDSKTNQKIYVEEANIYDTKTEINHLTWYFLVDNEEYAQSREFSMRMYFPSRMNQMLSNHGFKICHQWGDYYRTPLNEGSKLQIYDVVL